MKKFLITAAALMAFLFAASTAQAATVEGKIKVQVYGPGKAFVDGAECGTSCTIDRIWDDVGPAPTVTVTTVSTRTGYVNTNWGNCNSLPSMNECKVILTAGQTRSVYASFFDTQAPTVFINGYTPFGGDHIGIGVDVSDNTEVTRVEYLLDDEVILTKTADFSYGEPDTTGVPEGEHTIQVRAYDANRNMGTSATYSVVIDHTAPVVGLKDPVTLTRDISPGFEPTFAGSEVWGANCTIRKKGGSEEPEESCWEGEVYSKQIPAEGEWEMVLEAYDRVGNVTRVVHGFVVDRTAPAASLVSGPVDGAEVTEGVVAFEWALDQDAVIQTCFWDEVQAADCEGNSSRNLTEGSHDFRVEISDQAGNVTTLGRSFSVIKDPADGPDPDPDTPDRTAPVVKLLAPKQTLNSMSRALRLKVRCDEACSGRVVVKGSGLKFAGRVYLAKAGVAKLKLRPAAKVRKRLLRLNRSIRSRSATTLKLAATARLSDTAGNATSATLRFRVGA